MLIYKEPILYSFKRCPYAMRARMALKLGNIKCELREVKLSNKPEHMIKISPKATVPVLITDGIVIEESIDIINWAIKKKNIFKNNISKKDELLTEEIIELFDTEFKYHLDRYKYSSRYKHSKRNYHRDMCISVLLKIELLVSKKHWFFGKNINKIDISILPFIRQFRIADPDYFDQHKKIVNIKNYLDNFLNSSLYHQIMHKYEAWTESSEVVYFP